MAWQFKADWVANPRNPTNADLDNIAKDQGRSGISAWGGDVDAGGYRLLNTSAVDGVSGSLSLNGILTLAYTGNAGFGTTTPGSNLTVKGASTGVANTGIFEITAVVGDKLAMGMVDGSYSWIEAFRPGVGVRNLILNPDGGRVGIGGTNPSSSNGSTGTIFSVDSAGSAHTVMVAQTGATSGSNLGGILEVRSNLTLSGGDLRFGQLSFVRVADVTSGRISSSMSLYINNDGGLVLAMAITPVGDIVLAHVASSSYANNAAAVSAGLAVGTLYRITGGDQLAIVH